MSVLNTSAIGDAIVDLIKAADLSFAPLAIAQLGDLSAYPENPSPSADVPAVFVNAIGYEIDGLDMEGEQFWQVLTFRVLLVNNWSEDSAESVWRKRQDQTDELVSKAVIRNSGDNFRLEDSAADPIAPGVEIESSMPSEVELAPPEHALVSQDSQGNARRLFATAFTLTVRARATR